jgi:hypothetical protein
MARRELLAFLLVLAGAPLPAGAQPAGESLEGLPLLAQPEISVDAVGLRQSGRHVELAGLVTNKSPKLDGREATVTLVGFAASGEVVTQETIELASIPAATTVAASVAIDMKTETRIARGEIHVSLGDAPILRAEPPIALEPVNVALQVDKRTGQLLVTGQVTPGRNYPVDYRVDAVVVDERGTIVGSARMLKFRVGKESTPFAAKGLGPPGADASALRVTVTILPGDSER